MSETPRTFVNEDSIDIKAGLISITDKDEFHHLVKVVRVKTSDTIIVLDGKNTEYECKIINISKPLLTLEIMSSAKVNPYPSFNLTLVQGITKGDKQDFIIQKCTELGVNNIINIQTDRSNVHFKDETSIIKKQQRWQKIAFNAAKQSKRASLPAISIIENLKSFLDSGIIDLKNDTIIACVETENGTSIKTYLKSLDQRKNNTYVLIGPEGGWSQKELGIFKEYEVKQVHLGQNILRSETASIIAIGIVLYELEL